MSNNKLQESLDELDRLIEVMQGGAIIAESLAEARELYGEEQIDAKFDQKTELITELMTKRLSVPKQIQRKVVSGLFEELSDDERHNLLLMMRLERSRIEACKLSEYDKVLVEDYKHAGVYPYKYLMSRSHYEYQKYELQVELLKLQSWVHETGQRVIIVFEGRDASGKGGTIKRFLEHLNSHYVCVVALPKPTKRENEECYFQRYLAHLPSEGEMVLLDRSWYSRAGIERVMGFCSNQEFEDLIRQVPEFERELVKSGIHLIKFWFSVTRDEQLRRFKKRQLHPLKQWKLSDIDMVSLDKWDDFTYVKELMFRYTETDEAPWAVVKSNCKKRARLEAIRYVLSCFDYANKDSQTVGTIDPLLVGRANVTTK